MTAAPDDVVRTRRLEVLDARGRPRVVVGDLATGTGEPVFGLAVLDEDGRHRAWLALHPHGPALAVDWAGNALVELGVDDPHPEVLAPGAYLHLADADGRPAWGCRVDHAGGVTAHHPAVVDPDPDRH